MKPLILATTPIEQDFRADLEARYRLTFDDAQRTGVRAIIANGAYQADGLLMDGFPDLGLICCIGSGYDGIDLSAAKARGVQVSNTAGSNAGAVADFAIGLLLSSIRSISASERYLRNGEWRGPSPHALLWPPGLSGRKIGIIGMGAIARQIVRRLSGFDVEVAYTNPRQKSDVTIRYVPSLVELSHWSDALILAHRADETNRGMIGADVLKALGPKGHMVNVSRGSAVDENALIAAIEEGWIAGAAMDVFDNEPDVRPDILALPNTVLTPHIAGGSHQSYAAMYATVGANLDAYFAGAPLPNSVVK